MNYPDEFYVNIKIPPDAFTVVNGKTENTIKNLKKINIFVGANNSGKSRLLRYFLGNIEYASLKSEKYSTLSKQILDDFRKITNQAFNDNAVGAFPKFLSLSKTEYVVSDIEYENNIKKQIDHWEKTHTDINIGGVQLRRNFINSSESYKTLLELASSSKLKGKAKIYIPILRGLRPLGDSASNQKPPDQYASTTNRDYNIAPSQQFTGQSIYEQIRKMLLGKRPQKDLVREYEDFLKDNFFDGQDVDITSHEGNKDDGKTPNFILYVKIGNEPDRPIYELGDGMQTLIINTFPAFLHSKKSLILFIEEPEIMLHPGYQRNLIKALCTNPNFEDVQVFITTHSNHLLDIVSDHMDDVSIFSCSKKEEEGTAKFYIENIGKHEKILNLLGVRRSSVFLSNCSVWIEGISDRLYIKKFLDMYVAETNNKNNFEEDKHYSILEYGGGNITHFNFSEEDEEKTTINIQDAVDKNNLVIADNDLYDLTTGIKKDDKIPNKKGARLKLMKETLGDKFCADYVDIENILPLQALETYINKNARNAVKWELKKTPGWAEFEAGLNNFKLDELLWMHIVQKKNGVNDNVKLFSDKLSAAKDIIAIMDDNKMTFSDLPESAQMLTKKIYEFIEGNNR